MLIDADNTSKSDAVALMEEVAKYGLPTVKRAYGDWTSNHLSGWKDQLNRHAIQPVQQFAYTTGKNSTDFALVIDAMDLLYSGNVDAYAIVSSDSDFTRLVTRLRESGVTVYGFGRRKTPEPLQNACDRFFFLEVLTSEPAPETPGRPGHPAPDLRGHLHLGRDGHLRRRRLGQPRRRRQHAQHPLPVVRLAQLRLPAAQRAGPGPGLPGDDPGQRRAGAGPGPREHGARRRPRRRPGSRRPRRRPRRPPRRPRRARRRARRRAGAGPGRVRTEGDDPQALPAQAAERTQLRAGRTARTRSAASAGRGRCSAARRGRG